MSIFYTFPYKNSADDFSPTLFIIEPIFSAEVILILDVSRDKRLIIRKEKIILICI